MSQAGQFFPSGVLATLTGDAGGAISPVAGNIDVLGGPGITVTGSPGTLTIAHTGAYSDSFPTDAGTAVPVAGDTNILGGANINTTGAGNTVTVILDDDVTLAGFMDVGTTLTVGTTVTLTSITDGVLIAGAAGAVSALTGTNGQVVIGSTGADPVFANITSTGGTIEITEGAGTLNLESLGASYANTFTISPSGGGDYTTIQAALTANPTADTLFLVYPGTYASDTINFTANNQSIVGMGGCGCAADQVISVASADICDFAAYTDCLLENLNLVVSAAASTVYCVRGTTGSIKIVNCILNCTNSSAALSQPACVYTGGAATVDIIDSCVYYTNDVAAGLGIKVPFVFGADSVLLLDRIRSVINCADAAFGAGFYFSNVNAYLEISRCDVDITATTATNVTGVYYTGTPAYDARVSNSVFNVTVGAANTGSGLYTGGTAVVNSHVNRYNIADAGGTSYSFIVAAGTTINSRFDDITAADGVSNAGTFTEASCEGNGDLVASNTVFSGTFDTNVAAAGVTLSGTTLSADGTDSDIDINITAKGTGQVIIDDLQLTTDLAVSEGGTGVSTFTDHGVLLGSGAAAITATAVGATGEVFIGNTGADASWSATPAVTSLTATTVYGTTFDTNVAAAAVTLSGTTLSADGTDADIDINITAKGTGQVIVDDLQLTTDLAVSEGGTGVSTLTDHGVLVGSGAAAITPLAVGTNGQVLIGSTGADPVFASITSGDASITITPGAGTLDLVTSVSGIAWSEQTGTSQAMVANNGYILNNAALVTATLPATAAVGSVLRVVGKGAGGWAVAQNAGQTIYFSSSTTTTGVGGSLASTDDHDCVEMVCITADTDFSVISSVGNITIT